MKNNICYGYIYNYSHVNSIHREEERCKQRSFPLYTISEHQGLVVRFVFYGT